MPAPPLKWYECFGIGTGFHYPAGRFPACLKAKNRFWVRALHALGHLLRFAHAGDESGIFTWLFSVGLLDSDTEGGIGYWRWRFWRSGTRAYVQMLKRAKRVCVDEADRLHERLEQGDPGPLHFILKLPMVLRDVERMAHAVERYNGTNLGRSAPAILETGYGSRWLLQQSKRATG